MYDTWDLAYIAYYDYDRTLPKWLFWNWFTYFESLKRIIILSNREIDRILIRHPGSWIDMKLNFQSSKLPY